MNELNDPYLEGEGFCYKVDLTRPEIPSPFYGGGVRVGVDKEDPLSPPS